MARYPISFGFRNFPRQPGIDTSSGRLDLPGKLTLFFKKGIGRKYVSKVQGLDEPIKKQHQEYLEGQFAMATNDYYMRITQIDPDRFRAYEDFAAMEYSPEIASALDIYSDESLTKDESGIVLKITCDNEKITKVLENLFNDILDTDHNLWHWTRNLCKYGNHYLLLDVQENKGIVGYLPLPVREIEREEAYDGNLNSVKFNWQAYGLSFDNWQLAHFRLLTDQERLPYGTSTLESVRRIWKQLQLAEDAMVIYRITRAPERRIFYLDVGNIAPKDVPNYIKEVKSTIKKAITVEQQTGNITFRYNPISQDEDYYIPVRGDKSSKIETLPGAQNLGEIEDVKYLQNKMFASLKIPKAYLTFEEDVNSKATLSGEDFRFARTINRIQQAVLTELNKIAVIHLYTLGFREGDQLSCFSLELTNPSTQAEIKKLELMAQRAAVFSSMWSETTLSPISLVWGLRNIFNFSDEDIREMLKQQYLEGKIKLDVEGAAGIEPGSNSGSTQPEFGQSSQRSSAIKVGDPFKNQKKMDRTTDRPFGESVDIDSIISDMIRIGSQKTQKIDLVEALSIRNKLIINNTLSSENTNRLLENINYSKSIDFVDLKGRIARKK